MKPQRHRLATQWRRPVAKADLETVPATSAVPEFEPADSAAPFWALMAFTFILLIAPQSFFPVLAPLRIALITAGFAVMAYLLDRIVRHRPFFEFTRELRIAVALTAWAILTMPLSYWPGGSAAYLADFYSKTLIVFWLLSHVVTTLPRLRFVAWGLSLIAVPLAASAVANFMSGRVLQQGLALSESRIVGYDAPLTGNPNDLALTLNLILPLSLALFLAVKKPALRAVLLACICLDAIAIIATFSRAGFLTLVVTFITYLWILFKRHESHWAVVILLIGFVVAVPLLPSSYLDRLGTITNIEADPTGSAQERWSDSAAAMQYVAHHPIVGAGLGMNALALNEQRGAAWRQVHNVYLQYAVDLGIPGLILFVMLLVGALKCAKSAQLGCAEEPKAEDLFFLAEGLRVSLVAFAVSAFFHPVAYHFYFYFIAGLALAAKAIRMRNEENLASGINDSDDSSRR